MPKRNLLLLCLMTAIGLVSWLAREGDQGIDGDAVRARLKGWIPEYVPGPKA